MNAVVPYGNALPAPVFAEGAVVSDQQIVDGLYERAGMSELLRTFAFGEPLNADSTVVTSEDDC